MTLSENPEYQETVLQNPKRIVNLVGGLEGKNETTLETLVRLNEARANFLIKNADVDMLSRLTGIEQAEIYKFMVTA